MPNKMRMNSISDEMFRVNADGDRDFNKIVASGRLAFAEYIGPKLNKTYPSRLAARNLNYADVAKKHMVDKIMFCAARARAVVGRPAPSSLEEVQNDQTLMKDEIFFKTMAAIDTQVISPIAYRVISDLGGEMMDVHNVAYGGTKELVIPSGEAFLWEDSSPAGGHAAPQNYLYANTVTLTPKAYACNAKMSWPQMVGIDNGLDAGMYYSALLRGFWSKITGLFTGSMISAFSNSANVPSYLLYNAYNSSNWANATKKLMALLNINSRSQLAAFGEYNALQAVLPSGTASDAALTYGLGMEWMKNGFIGVCGGVRLYESIPAMVPGTAETTGSLVGLGDNIVITATGGAGYAPMQAAMVDGQPMTLEYGFHETGDYSIMINGTAWFDVKPVFARKCAVIQNVG